MINYKGLGWINQEWVGGGGDTKLIKRWMCIIFSGNFCGDGAANGQKKAPPF